MQQTSKYQFKLIEGTDDFSPGPLNDNMEMVEEQFEAVEEEFSEVMTNLGSGGNTARIIYGSYVGTGTYGEDNPNQLTFSFEPKMWGILCESYRSTSNNQAYFTEISIAVAWGVSGTPSDSREIQYAYSGNTVSWYSGENVGYQKNQNNHTYYYFALG